MQRTAIKQRLLAAPICVLDNKDPWPIAGVRDPPVSDCPKLEPPDLFLSLPRLLFCACSPLYCIATSTTGGQMHRRLHRYCCEKRCYLSLTEKSRSGN
jgi:hypothetical protein